MHRMAGRSFRWAVVVGVVVLLTVTGCATSRGGVMGSLSRAADQASSAAQSGTLAYQLETDGSTIPGVSDTALKDALKELDDADTSAQNEQPESTEEITTQQDALTKIRAAEDAILHAQQTGADNQNEALDGLRNAADDLSALGSTLKQFQ